MGDYILFHVVLLSQQTRHDLGPDHQRQDHVMVGADGWRILVGALQKRHSIRIADQLDASFRYPATSIAIERRETVRLSDLLLAFLKRLEANYTRFREHGLQPFLADLERTSAILGRSVTIHCGPQQITGVALGLTSEGALRLRLADGQERVVWVGDITRVADGF